MADNRFECILILPNGISEVFPVGLDNLTKTEEINTDLIFFRTVAYSGKLIFQGADYTKLYNWEHSNKREEKATLIIKKKYFDVADEKLRFIIDPDELIFQPEKCTCELKVDVKSSNTNSYEAVKSIEQNIFALVPTRHEYYFSHFVVFPPGTPDFSYKVANAVTFLDAIEALLNIEQGFDGSLVVKSKLFGWNASKTYTVGSSGNIEKLILSQRSDIYNRQFNVANSVPAPATKMSITAEDMLKGICAMFNCKCDLDNNILQIEHVSYWDSIATQTFDATTGANLELNNGTLSDYETVKDGKYKTEFLETADDFASETGNTNQFKVLGDNDGYGDLIKYDTVADNLKHKKETIKFMVSFNIKLHKQNPSPVLVGPEWESSINDGIFIGAVGSDDLLLRDPDILGDPYNLTLPSWHSNVICWSFLSEQYHLYDKSFKSGIVNGNQTNFIPIRSKVQKDIKIKDCEFTANLLFQTVQTGLGDGRVQKVTRRFGEDYSNCEVYFREVAVENVITTPVVAADSYSTSVNTTINTSAQALSSLKANDTPSTSTVYAEDKKTIADGRVVISSNGHFIYYPPLSYTGEDTFEYYLINAAGNTATGVCTITIT